MGANCPKMSNYWDSSAILSEIVHFLYALTGVYHLVALLTVLMPIHTPDSNGKSEEFALEVFEEPPTSPPPKMNLMLD